MASDRTPSGIFQLPCGIYMPDKESLILINREIIRHRAAHGQFDPCGVRTDVDIDLLCYRLGSHKYSDSAFIENALYVSGEILFTIACRHPFLEGNKSTAFSAAIALLEINLKLYAGPRTGRVFRLWRPSRPEETEAEGRMMERIAKWGENDDSSQQGKPVKKKAHPGEARRFIKEFLSKYILED
jgi:hypothetical protein